MRAHIALKVKVGELIGFLKLEELAELLIGKDATTVLGVLKLIGTNVRINLASNLSAGHLGSVGLAKESGELLTNLSGLDKTAGGTVSRLALLASLTTSLFHLALSALRELTNLRGYTGKLRTKS